MTTEHSQAAQAIRERRDEIAGELVALEFARHPELEQRYGPIGREKSLQDAGYHLAYLAEALALDNQALFVDYIAWTKVMLAQRRVLPTDLAFHLQCTAEVLRQQLPGESGPLAAGFVDTALREMPGMPEALPSFLEDDAPLSPLAHQYLQALLRGERQLASRLILDVAGKGSTIRDIYLRVFQPVQREIGRLWQMNQISVAQEHYCTAATQLVMSQLYPRLFVGDKSDRNLVASCVAGDLHELGVRMVADFFEMAGWNTFYTGASTPHPDVIRTVIDRKADVLGISATITYHVHEVEKLIAAVRRNPDCGAVKILVGGYPFNIDPELWRQVGADGWAEDADRAIAMAEHLLANDRR